MLNSFRIHHSALSILHPPMPDQPSNLPGKGLLGWLGRQVGYVSGAVKTKPGAVKQTAAQQPRPAQKAPLPKVIYRDGKVEEAPHPTQPGVKLRRTIIDEVVVDGDAVPPPPPPKSDGRST
jgi:hypothetical protein